MTMVENGNYDRALRYSVKKLAGKKNKNPKYLESLELSFSLGNEEDLHSVLSNIDLANSHDLKQLLLVLNRIESRQNIARPFVNVSDKNGKVADFEFIKVGKLRKDLNERLERSLRSELAVQVALARKLRKKEDARTAYNTMVELIDYYPGAESVSFLNTMATLKEWGTIYYNLEVDIQTSESFIRTLTDKKNLPVVFTNQWYRYSPKKPDIMIRYRILDISISPERISEKEYWDSKEIEDGEVALRNEGGEKIIDSSGQVVFVPRFKKIRAQIKSVSQFKEGTITGEVAIFSSTSGELLFKEPLNVVTNFENHFAEFRGSKKALTSKSKKLIRHEWLPFPGDRFMIQEMIDQAWDKIPSVARLSEYRILKAV
jgi:hypothetical protein